MHRIENNCYRTGKYTVCRLVRASFSPEILQAGAVKGLKKTKGENLPTILLVGHWECGVGGMWCYPLSGRNTVT